MIELVLATAAFCSLALTSAWLVQRATGNCGWVDVTWTFTTAIAGCALVLMPAGSTTGARGWLVAACAGLWGVRLGLHIARRAASGVEDVRYAALRAEWGPGFERRLFWFLQIQAAVAFVLAGVIGLAGRNPAPGLRSLDILALMVAVAAIGGEALADQQLHRFRADLGNKGRVCDTGLWAWSRHPNYFFEWLAWLSYPLFAINLDGSHPWGWAALAGPAVMYWTLVYASGIPMTEAQMLKSRGAAFRAYQLRTSAFFPRPPVPRSRSELM